MTEIYLTISLSTHNGDDTPQKEATVFPHHNPKAETLKFSVACIMCTRILSFAQNVKKIIYHCHP